MSITVDEMVGREVLCCVSSLIDDLNKLVSNCPHDLRCDLSVDEDDLTSILVQDDWEEPARYHISSMDRDDLVIALDDAGLEDGRDPLVIEEAAHLAAAHAHAEDWTDYREPWVGVSDEGLRILLLDYLEEEDGWQEFCSEHDIDPEQREAYEHWAVTYWLAARLKERGEMVADICNLKVWGRCTTGQSISMDGVIEAIHRDLVS